MPDPLHMIFANISNFIPSILFPHFSALKNISNLEYFLTLPCLYPSFNTYLYYPYSTIVFLCEVFPPAPNPNHYQSCGLKMAVICPKNFMKRIGLYCVWHIQILNKIEHSFLRTELI